MLRNFESDNDVSIFSTSVFLTNPSVYLPKLITDFDRNSSKTSLHFMYFTKRHCHDLQILKNSQICAEKLTL